MLEEPFSSKELGFDPKEIEMKQQEIIKEQTNVFITPNNLEQLGISTKIIRLPGYVPSEYKTGPKKKQKYMKKIRRNVWVIPTYETLYKFYNLGHFSTKENNETVIVSNTLPKILPKELGILIFNILTDNFKKVIDLLPPDDYPEELKEFEEQIHQNKNIKNHISTFEENIKNDLQYEGKIPCVMAHKNENNEVIFKLSKIKRVEKSAYSLIENLKDAYYKENCYLTIDAINYKKIFQLLSYMDDFVYVKTRGKVLKLNKYSQTIENMFNKMREEYNIKHPKKKIEYEYKLLDNETPKARDAFLKYLSSRNTSIHNKIDNDNTKTLKKRLNKIITIKMLKKEYKKFYLPEEIERKENIKKYYQSLKISDEIKETLSKFYAHLSLILNTYLIACYVRNIYYKVSQPRLKKQKLKINKTKEEIKKEKDEKAEGLLENISKTIETQSERKKRVKEAIEGKEEIIEKSGLSKLSENIRNKLEEAKIRLKKNKDIKKTFDKIPKEVMDDESKKQYNEIVENIEQEEEEIRILSKDMKSF